MFFGAGKLPFVSHPRCHFVNPIRDQMVRNLDGSLHPQRKPSEALGRGFTQFPLARPFDPRVASGHEVACHRRSWIYRLTFC